MPKRIIVCGGRDYADYPTLDQVLNVATSSHRGNVVIVEGGARGADTLAHRWALSNGVQVETHSADWKTYGKSAGPIRNRAMLAAGADLVVAFPGGRGTADMVAIAEKEGVPVFRV